MICWQQMESHRGSSDRAGCTGNTHERSPSTTKDARQRLSPTETQRYQPSRKGTGSKEDRPRDAKTTSTHTYNQPKLTETTMLSTNDTTWLTTAQDGWKKWDSIESDFVSSRLTQPIRSQTNSSRTHNTHDSSPRQRRRRRRRRRHTTHPLPTHRKVWCRKCSGTHE